MNHILMAPHRQSLKGEGKENINRDKKKVWDSHALCYQPQTHHSEARTESCRCEREIGRNYRLSQIQVKSVSSASLCFVHFTKQTVVA